MDDWKLMISPVVRLNRPNKRFFYFLFVSVIKRIGNAVRSIEHEYLSKSKSFG